MKLDRRVCVVAWLVLAAACNRGEPAKSEPAPSTTPPAAMAAGSAAGSAVAAPDPWTKPAAKKDPLPRPLFWSIEKNGKTTYLLGTIHMGVDAETRLPDYVWKDLDAEPTFAMETDLSDAGNLTSSFMRTSGTLHDELGAAYWKKLQDQITPAVAKNIDGMKAMVPASLLSMRGMPQTAPMDGNLVEHAKREHKKIVFLEPAKLQIDVLDKYMDARALKEMLDDTDGAARQKELLDAYIAGDEVKMQQLTDAEKDLALKFGYTAAEYDAEMEDMLFKRNASWIDEIDKLTQDGGGFVAVGAMHLLGKRSVLDLLAQRGYKVTRLTSNTP